MINFISISLILISMFYTFRWSINKSYIDNTFDLLCSSIKNTCFLYLYNEEFVTPYIDETNIEYVIESYLNINLKRITNKYSYGLYFYDDVKDETLTNIRHESVRISLHINIDNFFNYSSARRIEAHSNE